VDLADSSSRRHRECVDSGGHHHIEGRDLVGVLGIPS
jgi:hypothetical protein